MFDEGCRRLYWWAWVKVGNLQDRIVAHMTPRQRATMERMEQTMKELGHRG